MENIEPLKALKSKNAGSVYIHIPFCKRKCSYCAFTSFAALNLADDYIKKLTTEIKHFYKGTPLNTLYIGGGTPSLLDIKHFKKIFSLFNFDKNAEITVEINPDSTDLKLLSSLYNLGVNRLSIGIQSFDDDILNNIGRLHTAKKAKDAVFLAQDTGFQNISIDLIYGLPKQNMKLWENDLTEAKSLGIQHISLYGLKIEEGTVFYKNQTAGKLRCLPDDDTQADMYEFAVKFLAPEFELYEISNFTCVPPALIKNNAAADDKMFQSRHNLNYWNEGEYYGFGISASGFLNNIRYQNTKNFKEYMENPLKAKATAVSTKQEKLEETIFLGFRKREGINTESINEKFEIDFDKKYAPVLQKFLDSKHIEKTKNGYRLTISGILVSNIILSEFLC